MADLSDSMRERHYFLFYILDNNGRYYYADIIGGQWQVFALDTKVKLKYSPVGLQEMKIEMGTNRTYFSLNRAVTYPFKFIKDGAAILRHIYYLNFGYNSTAFLMIEEYNTDTGGYDLYYKGRIDFTKKNDQPKTGEFTVNCVDISAWGILSQNDSVVYQIQCNRSNPKAIRVLFDGINLEDIETWQPISDTIYEVNTHTGNYTVPLVHLPSSGDTAGVIAQDQDVAFSIDPWYNLGVVYPAAFMYKTAYPSHIEISGTIHTSMSQHPSGTFNEFFVQWAFWRSTDTEYQLADLPPDRVLHQYHSYGGPGPYDDTFSFTQSFDLAPNEVIKLIAKWLFPSDGAPGLTRWVFRLNNIVFKVVTKAQPTVAYALRPLDLGNAIVSQATKNRYGLNSDFYTLNNRHVTTCGNALRGNKNAYISSSYEDWFKSYDYGDFLAMRIIKDKLWVEEADTVYDSNNILFDVGEIEDVSLEPALDWLCNQVEVGGRDQDYRHNNGRYEFNLLKKFSLDTDVIKNILSLVPPYRIDGYGIEFLRLDYQQDTSGQSTDNSGDSESFMTTITDEIDVANILIDNFESVTVTQDPLAPIIKSPLQNDTINNLRPTVKGLAPAGKTINIYVDSTFDGFTTADANNQWTYNIVNDLLPYQENIVTGDVINSGVHVIEASFSDLQQELSSVTVNIFTGTIATRILNPQDGDYFYDNKFKIYGVGQAGATLSLIIDALTTGVVVDGSGKWEYQLTAPLNNGTHTITAVNPGVDTDTVSITVDITTITLPVITDIQYKIDGFPIITGLPIVRGIAPPGTVVTLYADYYPDRALGTATADSNGDWSFTLVPTSKVDGTVLAPLSNGEHIISTNIQVLSTTAKITGYKLERQFFGETISGVFDNTVMNIHLSPKRAINKRASFWKSIMYQKQQSFIKFQTGMKNNAVQTQLGVGGPIIDENADVKIETLPTVGMFYPDVLKCKAKMPRTFNDIFTNFNQGGVIRATYQGNEIFLLPIGTLSVDDVTNDVQDMSLLISVATPLTTLQNLYKNGLTINIMDNAVYHSDFNTLHFVKYDFQTVAKYNNIEIYSDFFENRISRYATQPTYSQKWSKVDPVLKDQIITQGVVGTLTLDLYRCGSLKMINSVPYTAASPNPIPDDPDSKIVMEAQIDLSIYPDDFYYFVFSSSGTKMAISERIDLRERFPKTILFEAFSLINKTDFFYTTGIQTVLRVEGLIQTWQPNIDIITNTDEIGDAQLLHGVSSRKRRILIADARGIPDYLALKIGNIVGELDNLNIDGVSYTMQQDNKLEENDRILGHPLYRYYIDVELSNNTKGVILIPPIVTPTLIVWWGWQATPFTTAELPGFAYQHGEYVDAGLTILGIDYTGAGPGQYLVLKYPKGLGIHFNCWENNPEWNYGQIPDQVFAEFEDTGFYYAYTRVAPALDPQNRAIEFYVCDCNAVSIAGGLTLPDAVVGSSYVYSMGLFGDTPFSFAGTTIKPAWMNINIVGSSVVFSGTPTAPATGVTVSFQVRNCGNPVAFTDTINVTSTCTNVAITSPSSLPDAVFNAPYSHSVPFTGTTPAVLNTVVKPTWMTITVSGNNVIFSGTPNGLASSVAVSFGITNCAGVGSDTFFSTVNVNPGISTMTIQWNRFSSSFTVGLSQALDASFTINKLFADGFTTSPCTGSAVSSAQFNGTWTISAGWTGDSHAPDSTSGVWSSATVSKCYNLLLNGVAHVNGDVVSIGSYDVTLNIQNCA